jgi:hypothetical protein
LKEEEVALCTAWQLLICVTVELGWIMPARRRRSPVSAEEITKSCWNDCDGNEGMGKDLVWRLSRRDQSVEGRTCGGAYGFLILVTRMFVCGKRKLSTFYEDDV